MKGKSLTVPISKTEAIVGWVWVFVHTFALGYVLSAVYNYALAPLGVELSSSQFNLVYYLISFLFLVIFLFGFLRSSFRALCSNILDTLVTVSVSYLAYYAVMYLVALVLALLIPEATNPNQDAVEAQVKLNPNAMIVVAVLLAPVVEETLFRGVVFGTIRKKNAFLAYFLSALLFSVYHLWSYMLGEFSWTQVVYLIQYIPAGIILALCYEWSKSLFGPILLHMAINFVSITIQLGT